jgi:carbon monoxide dehydrogenase subunit G
MEMNNSRIIPAPVARVWDALNDPIILKDSLPGCESLERVDDSTYKAVISAKIGPVSARFSGTMRIAESTPPTGYTLSFEGKGGPAGFASGEARVTLAPAANNATTLHYAVNAKVGGKIAQIGSRLIDGAAAKLADDFFVRFSERLSPPASAPTEQPSDVIAVEKGGLPWMRYAVVGIILVAAVYAVLSNLN